MTECTYKLDDPSIDAEEYCSCTLDKIMEEYPTNEEADLYITDEWAMATALDCLPY